MKPLTREVRLTGRELRESLINSHNFRRGMKSHPVERASEYVGKITGAAAEFLGLKSLDEYL